MCANPRKKMVVLAACMALQMTGFVIILPLFARRFTELGAGVEVLGISEMIYALASTVAAPFMGALADRFGRRSLVLFSLIAYAAAFGGYLLAQSPFAIIVMRGFAGAFTAGFVPAITGLAADLAPKDRQAQWMGFINGGASFGWIAGPLAGGILYDHWGYSTAVLVSSSMVIAALAVAFLGVPKSLRPGRPFSLSETGIPISQGKTEHRSILEKAGRFRSRLRGTLPKSLSAFTVLLFISFTVLLAWAFIEPRLMYYAYDDLGWSSSTLGLVMSAYGLALTAGELTLGGLSDRFGRKLIILLGLVLFSAQFLGLAFFTNTILIAVMFILGGLGNALYDPALNAAILGISPKEHSSRIFGIKGMVGSAGSILGPALVTLISSSIAARGIFFLAVWMVAAAVIAGLVFPGKAIRRQESSSRNGETEASQKLHPTETSS